jgi:hypothetical protein
MTASGTTTSTSSLVGVPFTFSSSFILGETTGGDPPPCILFISVEHA